MVAKGFAITAVTEKLSDRQRFGQIVFPEKPRCRRVEANDVGKHSVKGWTKKVALLREQRAVGLAARIFELSPVKADTEGHAA